MSKHIAQPKSAFDRALLKSALFEALKKLDPRSLWRNPVMFIVEVGAVWSTILAIISPSWFAWLIVLGALAGTGVARGDSVSQLGTLPISAIIATGAPDLAEVFSGLNASNTAIASVVARINALAANIVMPTAGLSHITKADVR